MVYNNYNRYLLQNWKIIDIAFWLLCCSLSYLSGSSVSFVSNEARLMLVLVTVNISLQGATEWPSCYHIAGDNNPQAVKRAANNICSLLKKNENKERWEEYK